MYYVGSVMCDGGAAIYHHGILGMKWGIRRFQNKDGSLTAAGRERYNVGETSEKSRRSGGTDVEARRARTKKYVKRGLAVAGALAAVGVGVAIARHPEVIKQGSDAVKKFMRDFSASIKGKQGFIGEHTFGPEIKPAGSRLGAGIRSAAETGGELYRQGRGAVTGFATDAAKAGGSLYRQGREAVTGAAADAARRGGELYRQGRDAVTGFATDAARRGGDLYRQGAKTVDDARRGYALGTAGLDPSRLGSRFRPNAAFGSAAAAGKSLRSFMQGVSNTSRGVQQGVQAFLASAARQGSAAYQNALKAVQNSGLYRSINSRLTKTNYAPSLNSGRGYYDSSRFFRIEESLPFNYLRAWPERSNPGTNGYRSTILGAGRKLTPSAGSYTKKQKTYADMRRLLLQGVEAGQRIGNSNIPWDQVRRYSPYVGAGVVGAGAAGGAAVAARKKKKRST